MHGEEALALAQELVPDVILLDITMPGRGGLAAASRIAEACPATRVVMLTVSEHEDDLLAAFKAGARAYVLKGVSAQEFSRVLRTVAAGTTGGTGGTVRPGNALSRRRLRAGVAAEQHAREQSTHQQIALVVL